MKKLRVGMVCPLDFSRNGGVQFAVRDLAKGLKQRGHYVKIIGAGTAREKNKDLLLFGKTFWLGINGTTTDFNIATGKELKRLKKTLKKENFDILHFHHLWNPFLGFQVLSNSQAPKVITYHDTPPNDLKGKILEKVVMPLASHVINSKYMDEVIAVSESPAKYLKKHTKKFDIISCGIFLDSFDPKKNKPISKYKDGKINILFLGRLEKRKGLIYLLKAFKKIKSRNPNIRLLVVGEGKLEDKTKNFIKKNKLKDVVLLGAISEKEKPRYYSTCDIFVAPSIYGESFGIVLVEAMASKKPVIAAANSGYKTVMKNQGSRMLVKPADEESLRKKLEVLINDKRLRERFGAWGLKESQQYHMDNIAEKVEQVYFRAIKNNQQQ